MTRDEMLAKVEHANRVMVHGWCTEERAKLLAETVYDNRLACSLCIGVYGGMSVVPVALALEALGHGLIVAVDPWSAESSVKDMDAPNAEWWGELDHEAIWVYYLAQIRAFCKPQYVRTLRMTNREALPVLAGQTFDYLEIDGNHGAEECSFDAQNFIPMVRSGGYIWWDDVEWARKGYDIAREMNIEEVCRLDTGALLRKR